MRESQTIVIARNEEWRGAFATEPCEAAWASEAVFFIRTLSASGAGAAQSAHVQISPDGMNWCDEGEVIRLPGEPGVSFCRVTHFGGWLRLAGELSPGVSVRVIAYLALKE
jgi:hypothetical protein